VGVRPHRAVLARAAADLSAQNAQSAPSAVPHVINAEVHSDDWQAAVKFEALDWFEQASDEEIKALMKCDFGGDYPADEVAQWMAERNEWVQHVFDYVSECREFTDEMGFECHIDPSDAYVWLAHYRPHLVDPDYGDFT
jgi:hypothetical protein